MKSGPPPDGAARNCRRTDPARRDVLGVGKRFISELALFCVGRQNSATGCLNLPAAGLKAADRGCLAVDREYHTAVPHIFAAGDVIGFPSLATTSSEYSRLAACYAFGVEAKPMAHFPLGIYSRDFNGSRERARGDES